MKINLRESLNKIDLATDNKYDLLNTFNSKKLSDNNKKKLMEAIESKSIASVNKILHESEEQLYKVVLSSGATKFNFESALYKDEAEGIVDYYDGRWIDENGFEWDMYVEEDDDSTEHAMVDDGQSFESLKEDYDEDVKKVKELITDVNSAFKIATNLIYFIDDDNSLSSLGYETLEMLKDVNKTKYRELLRSISSDIDEEDLRDYGAIDSGILDLLYDSHPIQEYIDSALNYILASKNSKKNDYIKKLAFNIINEVEEDELARFINDDLEDSFNVPLKNSKTSDSKSDDNIVYGIKVAFTEDTDAVKKGSWYIKGTGFEPIARDTIRIKDNQRFKHSYLKDKDFLKHYAYKTKKEAIKDAKNMSRYYQNGEDISIVEINLNDMDESLKEDLDLSEVEEIKELPFDNKRVNNLRGIFSTKALVDALNKTGLDKLKIRTSRLKNVSKGDLKDAWYDLKRNGWTMSIERDPSLSGFNEVYVFEKITNESLNEQNLKEDLSDLDLFLSTPVDTKQFNDETFRALKNLVSEYKKDLNSLDQWASESEKEPFVKKWYKLADKCKEIAKNGIRGITGYGRLNDFIKLKIVDLARSVDNTFPWYTRNNLAKFNKLESLTEDTVKQNGMWVNKGDTGKTHGKFKTKKAADQQRKAMFSNNYKAECLEESNDEDSEDKVAVFTKGIDGKSYYHGFMNRKEADKHYPDRLKESIDDEIDLDFEIDFDDGEVEEGNVFFADGTDWVWEERIAGPLYLDFDKWAVWSARESVDIRDFIIGGNANGGWDIDKEAYIEAVKSKPIVYFIVDEDTGFIDWGPVENEIEAKDFLNGKQDDWENDYYEESLKESFDDSTVFEIYYDDIDGEKADYYFEVPYKDVLEFLANYAEDEEDAPQDEEELLKYVDKNFDRLYNEYEYNVLDHFYEDASQEEYDRRHSSYESEYDPMD